MNKNLSSTKNAVRVPIKYDVIVYGRNGLSIRASSSTYADAEKKFNALSMRYKHVVLLDGASGEVVVEAKK
jgi:hypothetical protein